MHSLYAIAVALMLGAPAIAQVQGVETRYCGDYGAPHPDMPEEFGQFAFIIGDFDIDYRFWDVDAGDWGEPQYTARWNGRYAWGGRAIIDEWFDPGYGYRPQSGAGMNIRIFDEASGVWKTAWHYTANNEVRELHQEVREDGYLWLWQVYPEADERNIHFVTYDADHWARIERMRDPDSGEWVSGIMLEARRVSCE